jgi:predicted peptidase
MGGFGTWTLALRHPDRFAAIIPLCGGGDPADAARLKDLPIWAFHGLKDTNVPVRRTTEMIEAIRKAGGHPHLTLDPEASHDCWTHAYTNEALYTWLFAQRRGQPEVLTPGLPNP